MKYDFDCVVDRNNTNCSKWDGVESIFGNRDVLPMWVADMDFTIARPITEALQDRTRHEVYGYTQTPPSTIEVIISRMRQKYGWNVKPEWIVFTPGVVPALNVAVRAFTQPGDGVIIQEPVYHPFRLAVRGNCGSVVNNQLKLVNGRYEIDFDDLASKFNTETPGASSSLPKLMLLCNPHNPVGRVWSREELVQVGNIVIKNGAIIVSDEIHCELLFKGSTHLPFATLSPEFEQRCLVCMAPSKTFNLAGLGASAIIIPNPAIREKFQSTRAGILPRPNTFGFVALEAAYRYGDDWLEQLLDYLQGNLEFLVAYFEQRIPKIKVIKPEGTYLVWLDCRALGMNPTELRALMIEKARVGLEDGYIFGESGAGFQRMNIACPRAVLAEALSRIEYAINTLERC